MTSIVLQGCTQCIISQQRAKLKVQESQEAGNFRKQSHRHVSQEISLKNLEIPEILKNSDLCNIKFVRNSQHCISLLIHNLMQRHKPVENCIYLKQQLNNLMQTKMDFMGQGHIVELTIDTNVVVCLLTCVSEVVYFVNVYTRYIVHKTRKSNY